MTTITYEIDVDAGTISVKAIGHSGYAKVGSDIVCASISTAMMLTYDTMVKFHSGSCHSRHMSGTTASMEIWVTNYNETDEIIVISLVSFLKDLQKHYPKYVEVKEIK